jgi:hypothetical protein
MIDGRLELELGGTIPLADGTPCELIVPERAITDMELLAVLRERKKIRILPEGTKLVAILSGREPVSEKLQEACKPEGFGYTELGRWFERWDRPSSAPRRYVEVELGPTDESRRGFGPYSDGGLWLEVQGGRSTGLISSQIILPDCVSEEPATSLNHAYTLLSEAFEPWRISHTGNVYEQVLYQETNRKWYPLLFLRDQKELEEGQSIARDVWERFMREMTPTSRGAG